MVSKEGNNNNNNNKTGFFEALRVIFSFDGENLNEEDKKEVEALNAESAKSIGALEKSILADRKQSRKKLTDNLKVKETTLPKGVNKNAKNQEEKEDELEK